MSTILLLVLSKCLLECCYTVKVFWVVASLLRTGPSQNSPSQYIYDILVPRNGLYSLFMPILLPSKKSRKFDCFEKKHSTCNLACPSLILRVRGFVKRVSDSNDDACLLASTTKNIASNKTVIDV